MIHKLLSPAGRVRTRCTAVSLSLFTAATLFSTAAAQDRSHDTFIPGTLVVSRVSYEGNTFGSTETYPEIFNDPNISGVQGQVYLDEYLPYARISRVRSIKVNGLTTSFSSKSEGALMLSADRKFLTYMGYDGPVGAEGVSNSYTSGANLQDNTAPTFDRAVALISASGDVDVTDESNAFSGDNPRAAITNNGKQFYMAGNSDSTIYSDGTGPGTTIGVRYGEPGSTQSLQLGTYFANDRPDESTKKHVKDNNFRAIGIFNGNLYVAKGSGSNGDNGLFQVHKGTEDGLPKGGTNNSITELFGSPATDANGNSSPYTSFGFWFANPTTVYVADEGYSNLDANGKLITDPMAGLEKWKLVDGKWQLLYTIQNGLGLDQAETVKGYPVPTYTTGLRNLTGRQNNDGTVTIYAITGQYSTISGGEPDPTRLVMVSDRLAATSQPHGAAGRWDDRMDSFTTLQQAKAGEVFRGVAFAPRPARRDGDGW